jgi:uncharacterized protein
MSAFTLERPVWRRFRPKWLSRAAAHVRAGGHAAIVEEEEKALRVLLAVDERGKLTELGLWSLLAIEQRRWRRVKEGPAEGLATARIAAKFVGVVLDWCARDAMHPGPTRVMELDCIACAACCRDATVVLGEVDLGRFSDGGRAELTRRDYIKRSRDGRITLRFAKDGRCQMLAPDKRCSIYEIRPDNCRAFVAGSEACLAAREDTLGWRDGAPEGEAVQLVEMGKRGG